METTISARDRLVKDGYQLLDVPKILYDELSEAFGTGEETRVRVTGIPHGTFLVRSIAITHPEAALAGAIGVEVNERLQRSAFAIWSRRPTPDDEDSVSAPYAYLSLFASARETGVWTAVHGNHMADELTAELMYHGLNLRSPSVPFVSLVLMRSSQLVNDPACVGRAFWDGYTSDD